MIQFVEEVPADNGPSPRRRGVVVVDGMLECSFCRESKPVSEFYKKDTTTGYSSRCKDCYKLVTDAFTEANPEKRKGYVLKYKYGITLEQYRKMWVAQDGLCAICAQPERVTKRGEEVAWLSVDHDHACCPGPKSCGKCVRALLCSLCNHAVGVIERIGSVDPFIEYLKSNPRST